MNKGFTVVEMLIVICIIGLLTCISIPAFMKSHNIPSYEKATNTGFCSGKITNIGKASTGYYAEIGRTRYIIAVDEVQPLEGQQKYDILKECFDNQDNIKIEYFKSYTHLYIHTIERVQQ